MEGIDALETNFESEHQELAGANAARIVLPARLGFTNVTFFSDAPNEVETADQDELRGYVLSNGIDATGRLIGFVYPVRHRTRTGAGVPRPAAARSVGERHAVRRRPGVPGVLRHVADLRSLGRIVHRRPHGRSGPVSLDTADPDGAATIPDDATLQSSDLISSCELTMGFT